jgi:hypothetical protein
VEHTQILNIIQEKGLKSGTLNIFSETFFEKEELTRNYDYLSITRKFSEK